MSGIWERTGGEDGREGLSMPLTEHLGELRQRLIRVLLSVLVLGTLSLVFSREIFGFLMAPVLGALPSGGQSLIYTSGIEELNVLLKVGLYAGLFLSAPVALFQFWKFVEPGLLGSEKRFALPFVTLGTVFFTAGAAFCYGAVLPSMFAFLLSPQEKTSELNAQVEKAQWLLSDARRLWRLGDFGRASDFARRSAAALDGTGLYGRSDSSENTPEKAGESAISETSDERFASVASESECAERFARFEALLDDAVWRADSGMAVRAAVERHAQARALTSDHGGCLGTQAAALLETAARELSSVDAAGPAWRELWLASCAAARASAELSSAAWTRPMLSMREQLSLVLVLELAFGLIFELPLVMAALAMMGVLRFAWIRAAQSYAIVGCVIASALITPTGDVINLALMAVPMIVCFEVGALLVFLIEKGRRRAEAEEAEDN